MKKPRKTVQVMVRLTPEEAKHVREIVKANSGTVSDFVRMCINTQLAQTGDPQGVEFLARQVEQGLRQLLEKRVEAALRERQKQ